MVTFNSVPTNAAASGVFVEQEAVRRGLGGLLIPHKILVLGQVNSGFAPTFNQPQLILNKEDAWTRYGRGSLLSAQIEAALQRSGTVPIYALPLADDGSAVAASGQFQFAVTTAQAGTLALYIAGTKVSVVVTAGMTAAQIATAVVAAINANLDLPVTATVSTDNAVLTAKWEGEAGNNIDLQVGYANEAVPTGVTVTVVDMASGATDPVLTTALGNLGGTWYTEIVNPYLSAASLTAINTAGETRNDPSVKRQFVALTGYNGTYSDFTTALSSLNSKWITMVPVHSSPTAPWIIGASAAGQYASAQQANPGRPVKNLELVGVLTAKNPVSLTYAEKDLIVKAGGSWTNQTDSGSVFFGDLVTTYTTAPSGADDEAFRFTLTISNIQFKIYSLDQLYTGTPFDRGIVVDDDAVGGPTYAIRPKTVKAYAIRLIDELWVPFGLSKNRDDIVAGIVAEINAGNPGRIDLLVPDVFSAGLRIVAVKLEWAFTA